MHRSSVEAHAVAAAVGEPAGRIGPNAILRVGEACADGYGAPVARQVFAAAGLAHYLRQPPAAMVDEREVIALHRALHAELGSERAALVARDAGERTAAYLLAHRIPGAVQSSLALLPAALASRVLLAAVARHAWTFAGSGTFRARRGRPLVLEIAGNPVARGMPADAAGCVYLAATFETLWRALAHRCTAVVELECEARGGAACRFALDW